MTYIRKPAPACIQSLAAWICALALFAGPGIAHSQVPATLDLLIDLQAPDLVSKFPDVVPFLACRINRRDTNPDAAMQLVSYIDSVSPGIFSRVERENMKLNLRMRLWGNILATLEMDAGFGFFALTQHYSSQDKAQLFTKIKEAGWTIWATHPPVLGSKTPLLEYRKQENFKEERPMTPSLMLTESKIFTDLKIPPQAGITVFCGSSRKP